MWHWISAWSASCFWEWTGWLCTYCESHRVTWQEAVFRHQWWSSHQMTNKWECVCVLVWVWLSNKSACMRWWSNCLYRGPRIAESPWKLNLLRDNDRPLCRATSGFHLLCHIFLSPCFIRQASESEQGFGCRTAHYAMQSIPKGSLLSACSELWLLLYFTYYILHIWILFSTFYLFLYSLSDILGTFTICKFDPDLFFPVYHSLILIIHMA